MSKRQIDKMKRAGFKLDTSDSGSKTLTGRYRIQSGTFPDGSRFNNAREFHALANSSPERAKSVRYATLGRTSFYLNNKFDKVLAKFKTDKSKKLTGKSKKDNDSDVNRKTNGVEDSNNKSEKKIREEAVSKAKEDITANSSKKAIADTTRRLGGKGGLLALPVVLGCGAYNLSHLTTAYAKKYHIEQMVKYAMIFLNTADRIKAQGDISPEAVSYVGDLLTQADPREFITNPDGKEIKNPGYGMTATDAQAYKIAAHGDQTNLTSEAKKFKAAGYSSGENTGWLEDLSNFTKTVEIAMSPFDLANINISDYFRKFI
ncbi:hypothetical protein KC953_00680, partial [Candidatus Saccharibacteria bacterium]|nr:hypothetical protein [Candidatus Saccharibacteria bacterium]